MIDARSDAVTLPTQAMLDAMLRVGHTNDFLDEDTEVRMLESEAAVLTGKDEGLFVVSGTMANLVALAAYSQPGHFVFADEGSHIIQWECEGIERFTGMQCLPVPALGEEMMFDVLMERLTAQHRPAVLCVETSHNYSGGRVPSMAYMSRFFSVGRDHAVPVYIDGARLFNAAHALGVHAGKIASYCDSLSFSLSKGLSGPLGSLLVGSSEFIDRARKIRRMLLGGFRYGRQTAACGRIALTEMLGQVALDHEHAKKLWELIKRIDARLVDVEPPQTNLVCVSVGAIPGCDDPETWIELLKEHGVLARVWRTRTLRFAVHRHIGTPEVEGIALAIDLILQKQIWR